MIEGFLLHSSVILWCKGQKVFCIGRVWAALELKVPLLHLKSGFISKGLHIRSYCSFTQTHLMQLWTWGLLGCCSVCSAMEPNYSCDFWTATPFKWEENLIQLCSWSELLIFPLVTHLFLICHYLTAKAWKSLIQRSVDHCLCVLLPNFSRLLNFCFSLNCFSLNSTLS